MSIGYVLKEGFAGFKRARLAAITSVIALMVAVLLFGVLARLAFNGFKLVKALKSSIEIEVFLEDAMLPRKEELAARIQKFPEVGTVHFISKDSAAAIFRRDFGAEGALLADLNFLPASYRITITEEAKPEGVEAMVKAIAKLNGIDEIRFNDRYLRMLESRTNMLIALGGAIGFFVVFASMLLVFNTIRLTIYAKRDLIKAMKLVGATNGFIRRPFLIEGMIQGIIAAALSVGVIWMMFHVMIPKYVPQIGVMRWPFDRWYYLVGAMALFSIILGLLGSRWAARKFIKESVNG